MVLLPQFSRDAKESDAYQHQISMLSEGGPSFFTLIFTAANVTKRFSRYVSQRILNKQAPGFLLRKAFILFGAEI